MRIFGVLAALLVAVIAGLFVWLYVSPPDLIRVGSNYSAKIVCSSVFVSGRNAQEVLEVDVQAPGHPLLRLMRVSVDRVSGTVRTGLFGVLGGGLAVHRDNAGCATVADGNVRAARLSVPEITIDAPDPNLEWPAGGLVMPPENMDLDALLNDGNLTGPGMRAVVVVKDGKIIGERYGDGFDAETPLLGWSMTKTVTAAITGTLIRDGELRRDQTGLLKEWSGDGRADISLADLLGMAGDLVWNEGYGDVSDVTRMLYLEPDMAGFVAVKPFDTENDGGFGAAFNYSSGTSVLLSRIWQDQFESKLDALAYPSQALFAPLGMQSAVFEADARGTFVGSSYLYATARDWARFGQFLLQRGVWEGRSLLPVGFVDWMTDAHPASGGIYGKGHLWLRAPNAWLPGENPELPEDAFFLSGHDGQSVSVVPSRGLVVVRLGLTPTDKAYKVGFLVHELIDLLDEQ
ncbi:serine hydrolase domain-containing protein [Oricola sp.]|uniref:serine hydrolase domain-containing protein n=1 Tax=Oricola sp. TaxID=1979950 RepID=UPI003BAC7E1B